MSAEFRVALIGGAPSPVREARSLGVDVVLVHEPGRYDPEFHDICEQVVHVPLGDGPAVLAAVATMHERRPFDLVISATEDCGVLAGQINDTLGLPGTGLAVARSFKDKGRTRQVLADHGLSPVRFRRVRDERAVVKFCDEVNGPIVVKPAAGVASIHIHLVTTAAEAAAAFAQIREAGHPVALAEEFLSGPVVSLDTFSRRGRHVATNVCQYRMNERFVEWEYRTPAPAAERWRTELWELTQGILDAMGLRDGPAHSEFVLTSAGPRLLESHNRYCGLGVPDVVRRAYDFDPYRMFLAVQLGIEELPLQLPDPVRGAAIRFFIPPPGMVVGIDGIDHVPGKVIRISPTAAQREAAPLTHQLHDAEIGVVLPEAGHPVRPARSGKDLRNGYVIATGDDVDDAVAKCEKVVHMIRFEVA